MSKNNNNDNNEILFWKVFKNVVIRNLIFKVMGEQVIEYDDMKKYYVGNRVKFSNMISLNLISKNKLWTILKDKLISNQYIRIDKKGLSKFFKYCNEDLDTIKLLYKFKKEEINSIIDPINQSIECENEISLKYFINYIDEETGMKLPIQFNQINSYDSEFYITSMQIFEIVYLALKESNQQSDIDLLKNQLLYRFLSKEKGEEDFGFISVIYNNYPELYPKKEDSISDTMYSIPLETIIKLDSAHRDLQIKLFLNGFINFKKSFPSSIVVNNYNNYSLDDFIFLYKCVYKSNDLLVDTKKVDQIVNEMIKDLKCEKEKLKFLKLKLTQELTHQDFSFSYLCEYDDDFDLIDSESVVSYTFSMFSINGLKYLIETSFRFNGVLVFFPNQQVLLESPNLVIEFSKLYFKNDNHFSMKYNGWLYIISAILKFCEFNVLKEIIESVPDFPLKLISKLLYSFDLNCPSQMVKLINLLKSKQEEDNDGNAGNDDDDEYSLFFSIKSFKFSDYLIGLKSNFKIDSVSQFNHLKVLDDLFLPSQLSSNDNDNPNYSNFYKSLSFVINSVDIVKQAILNYPNAPKELFNNYLLKLLNNFDLESIKEIMKIIKFAKIGGDNKTFTFDNQGKCTEEMYKKVDETLNYLNEINFTNLFNENGISSFFIGLFNSFSNIDKLIENCPSFKEIAFSLFENQSSIIICEILFKQSFNFNDRLKIIKYILNEITTFTVFNYFSLSSDRDIIFNQEFTIYNLPTGEIKTNDLNSFDIIEIIEQLLKKVDKREINNFTTIEMIQILFDFLVQSKNVTLQQIEFIIELCDINSITLSIGYYHTFYFYNLKNKKLSNIFLKDPASRDLSRSAIFSKKTHYGKHFFFYKGHSFNFIKNSSFNLLVIELMKIYFQPVCNGKSVRYLLTINEPQLAISLLKDNIDSFKISHEIKFQSTEIIKSFFKSGIFKIPFQDVINELVKLDLEEFSIDKLLKWAILLERIDITNFIISNYAKGISNLLFGNFEINPFAKNCKLISNYLLENHKDVLLNSIIIDQELINDIKNQGFNEMYNLILKYIKIK
ncbi:hypothetical protein DDB_G0289895 [Dictyostelium discoideum AX4]|uniref:Ubiquinone biosynthesis protein n=1 Tax=Dictyostelium discoideum TaxID=44689 RepID=Q54GW2_DICDI|nr:hypothetical protein DDB_G0289895 [Dictyostelium discoideum AX4]EAL62460.1 hypothetical protein DDB_G0289895 [Dictyostelium discoideum AX4]|eukprot:XP_635957.1 hypothetical protein DDB_G0289895 [Dictyostelium discoideum AX4]